jgi:hypothetical protein
MLNAQFSLPLYKGAHPFVGSSIPIARNTLRNGDWGNDPVSDSDVSASEAATYAFCAKAWHLEHVIYLRPSDDAREWRRLGTAAHLADGSEFGTTHRLEKRSSTVIVGLFAISLALVAMSILLTEF